MIFRNALVLISVLMVVCINLCHMAQGLLNEGDSCIIATTRKEGKCTDFRYCEQPCARKHTNFERCNEDGEDDDGNWPIVCCPQLKRPASISSAKCQEYKELACSITYIANELNSAPLKSKSSNCAIDGHPVIRSGEETLRREFPHMALVGRDSGFGREFNCGGTLISNKFVLSAAHCIKGNRTHYVRLGVHDKNDETETQHIELKAVRFVLHPNRTSNSSYHDIVLIELEKAVNFNHAIRPACLPEESTLPQKALVTGWGYVNERERETSSVLMKTSVNTFNHTECRLHYKPSDMMLPHGVQEESQFCAGSPKYTNNTCIGDSGGPIQVFHKDFFCTYTIVGVTSQGYDCFAYINGSSGLYTKVFPYLKWIESVVWPGETV